MGIIDTRTFNMALQAAGTPVAKRAVLPVLSNVLLSAQDGILTLAGTNMEVGVRSQIGYEGEDFAITLPFDILNKWSKLVSAKQLTISIDGPTQSATIETDGSQSTFKGISADEFPSMPKPDQEIASIRAVTLSKALNAVVLASAEAHTNPILQGVLFRFYGRECTLAAIDGYCLSVQVIDLDVTIDQEIQIIVPGTSVKALTRILPTSGDAVVSCGVTAKQTQMIFSIEGTELSTRVIDGKFPDYHRFIPVEVIDQVKLNCNKKAFELALKRVALYLGDNNRVVRIDTDNEKIRLTVNSELGSAIEDIAADVSRMESPKTSAFNEKYLNELLASVDSDSLCLTLINESLPMVATPDTGTEATRNLFLVMPMRIP